MCHTTICYNTCRAMYYNMCSVCTTVCSTVSATVPTTIYVKRCAFCLSNRELIYLKVLNWNRT